MNICNFLDPFDIALDGSFKIRIGVDDNSRQRKPNDDINLSGTDEIWSENGVVIFENLKFTEPGDYKLYAKNGFIGFSEDFKLDIHEREYVTSIIVSSNTIFITAQKVLNVTVYLYSNDQLYVNDDAEVKLMADGIDFQGNYNIITVNGIAVFSIFFEKLGQSVLSAKTNEDIEDAVVTTLTVYSIDELCESFDTNWNCLQCIAIADFVDGHCKCVENSYYDEPYCKCYDGYTGDNGSSCEPCQNYFSNEELISYYKENYREIVIKFGDAVQNPEPDCSIILYMPDFYMKYLDQCIWVDSKTFLLLFSEMLPNKNFVIYLKSDLKPMNNICHLHQTELFVQVDLLYPYPSINENIIAPSSISISCIETNPIIKYSSFNSIYNYTWSAESSNQELNNYIAQQNSYSFELPLNYLVQETLYINSNVYYSDLNILLFSTRFSIEVTYSKIISVIIDLGNYIEVKSSNPLTLKAKIISTCNATGEYQFEWSYNTINNQNLDEYINEIQRPDTIVIPPNVLVPGYETSFTITVKIEDLYGSSTIKVYAKEDPLVLRFNRWDGKIGIDNDLEIIASAYDPSHIDAVISISWSCTDGLSYCIGNDGNILLDYYSDFILIIVKEKLRNGANYLFEATVSTDIKSTTLGIEIVIDKNLKGMISIGSLDDVIGNDMPYNLISKVTPFEESSFHWEFDPSPVDVRPINMDQSFLSIPQNFLEPGVKYKISLTMISSNTPNLVTSSFLMRNNLPTCEYLSIIQENSKYTLESVNCASSQGMLFYQFGYKIQENIFWITPKSFIPYVSLNIRSDANALTMKVCDDYECNTYENLLLTRFQRRHLSIIDDFNNDILTSDDIPPAVIYYIIQAENQETFDTIVYAMGNYFLTESIDITILDLFISCLSAVQENSYYINTNMIYYLKSITIGVLEKYSGSLSNDQAETFAAFFAPFIDYLEYSDLYELSTVIRMMWFKDQLPGQSTLNVSGNFMLYGKRVLSYELPGLDVELVDSGISISSDFEVDETAVVDISFAQFKLEDDSFDIMIYESGSFQNYSLVLKNPSKIYSEFDQNTILVKLFGDYDQDSLYICEVYKSLNSSDSSKCEITSISKNSIILTINHLSSFKIIKFHDSSEIGRGPVIAMGSVIILFISLIIFFSIVDYKIDNSPSISRYLILYPYTTLVFMQKNYRRVIISYQLLCNFLIIFFLIGVFQMKTLSPYKQSDENYGVYNIRAIYSGLYGWAISQGFIFPFFLYNCTIEKSRVGIIFQGILITMFIGASIYGILYMTLSYYSEYTFYWAVNIVIFIPIQVLIDAGYATAVKLILYRSDHSDKDEITERSSIEKEKQIYEEGKDDCKA